MEEANAVKLRKLYNKVKKRENKGMNIKEVVEKLGFDYASIMPPNRSKLSLDGAAGEVVKLRIAHHENKRLKILEQVYKQLKILKAQTEESTMFIDTPKKANFSLTSDDHKKELIEISQKRRTEASERALKLKFAQKMELLKKIKDKDSKTTEQRLKILASVKDKIDRFQKKEKNKLNSVKQHSLDIQETLERVIKRREYKSETPVERISKTIDKINYFNKHSDEEENIDQALLKIQLKMNKATERYNNFIHERVKMGEIRSQTVAKIRHDALQKKKQESDELLMSLLKLDKSIVRSRSKKNQYYFRKHPKVNLSLLEKKDPSSIEDNTKVDVLFLEKQISEKEKKVQEKIDSLKSKFELEKSLKQEKYKLTLNDIKQKREFHEKLRKISKEKILEKHIKTAKANEFRKSELDKFEQVIREKEYKLSQKYNKEKDLVHKEFSDFKVKQTFMITNDNHFKM